MGSCSVKPSCTDRGWKFFSVSIYALPYYRKLIFLSSSSSALDHSNNVNNTPTQRKLALITATKVTLVIECISECADKFMKQASILLVRINTNLLCRKLEHILTRPSAISYKQQENLRVLKSVCVFLGQTRAIVNNREVCYVRSESSEQRPVIIESE